MRSTILAGGILLGIAPGAVAQEHEAVRLSYAVPAECPDDAAFWERVSTRAAGAERSDAAGGRLFAVSVERRGRHDFAGRLMVTEGDAAPTERVIEAQACDEVVSALALIVAVAITERWEEERAAAATAPVPPPEPPPPVIPPSPAPAVAPPPDRAPRPDPPAVPRPQPWDVYAGAGVDVGIARAGTPVAGGAAVIAVRQKGGPGFRLTAVWAPAGSLRSAGQAARFTWWVARAEVCPISWLSAGRLRLEPCAVVEAGVLGAEGVGIDGARSAVRPWVAPGIAGRATLGLGAGFHLEVGVALLAAVVRDRFHFASGDTVLKASLLQPVVDGGVTWSIP